MRTDSIRPLPALRRLFYAVGATAFLSGIGRYSLHAWCVRQGEFGPVEHPLEPWLVKLHGLSSYAALVLLGAFASTHVVAAWRRNRHRLAGTVFLVWIGVLAGSGYVMSYIGSESAQEAAKWIHLATGLSAPLAFHAHRRSKGRGGHRSQGKA